MRVAFGVVLAAATLAFAGAAPATTALPVQQKALRAVREAQSAGRIDAATADAARNEIRRAAVLGRVLPADRAKPIEVALAQLAAFAGRLTPARAAILVGQLQANDDYFSKHWPPAPKTDVADADGVVYRWFPGRCLEFHPLANFGALNAHAAAHDAAATERLADALIARGTKLHGGGIGWEYEFPFGGGAPWLSGMAQAVAAQAFERAADVVPARALDYRVQARQAFVAIPGGLMTKVAAGPWIRLYAFSKTAVLNAQLQAVISLQTYAAAAGDTEAGALAARMQSAALATLPRFDTGYWTDYSLAGDPSPLDYQTYVVSLLQKLNGADPRFGEAATRIAGYATQPPAFEVADAGAGAVEFWLSKPSTVSVVSGAGPSRHLELDGGWHTLRWPLPKRPGAYGVHVDATDYAGNRAGFDALPIVHAAAADRAKVRATTAATPAVPAASGPLAIGAAVPDPASGGLVQSLGMRTIRVGVAWPAGATAPDPALVDALHATPPALGVVIELIADPTLLDDTGRAALAAYAAALVPQVPALTDLILVPPPSATSGAAYAAALTAVRTAVQATAPAMSVDLLIDGAASPKAAIAAIGRAGAQLTTRVAFRPAPAPAKNAWTLANLPQLRAALTAAFGGVAPILVDGLAFSSTIPPEHAAAYATPPPADAVPPAAQASSYVAAIRSVACDGAVAGILLEQLTDNPQSGATPGLYYADGTAKPSAAAVEAAAAAAQRASTVCPGTAAEANATTFAVPTRLGSGSGATFKLACDRDCLYLAMLVGAGGKPVVATRGTLDGGAAATTVQLPAAKLAGGPYRLDVRLVARVNPGKLTREVSPPIPVD